MVREKVALSIRPSRSRSKEGEARLAELQKMPPAVMPGRMVISRAAASRARDIVDASAARPCRPSCRRSA